MFARASRQSWVCPRCTRRSRRIPVRGLITSSNVNGAAAAAAAADFQPVLKSAPSISHDDRTLRQIFDSPSFWKEFSSRTRSQYGGKSAGLFQNRYLTKPEGFHTFAAITLKRCQRIVSRVLSYKTVEEYRRIAKDLDRLSDLLCRVIDLSDFVRSVHPDHRVQAAASQAYASMFEYMNVLNTTTGLNDQLAVAMKMRDVVQAWSEEERTVATMLQRDFAKSAIDLPDSERDAFVQISSDIAQVGTDFTESMSAEIPFLTFESSRLKSMDPTFVRQLTRWGKVALPTIGAPATVALRTVEDEDVRREIYMANRTSSQATLRQLGELLSKRAQLAKLSGYESFGHMTLADKMAKTPEAVTTFLNALAGDNAPRVQKELRELSEIKGRHARAGDSSFNAWDRDYYTSQLLAEMRSKSRTPDVLSSYFSLGTVFQGLSRLFHRLYGMRLVPRETLPGETWNEDVRRLDVIDDREGHIAVIYCDLFGRVGKSPNPAHFTLRCSRKIEPDEMTEATEMTSRNGSLFATAEEAANDGLATNYNPRDGNALYQLPTIALICDFALPPAGQQRPTLLSFRELTTLFHEMGHAVHSICGRTALQNVSGTRCATDFAELPSVLMENFAAAPEVLALYARHWETDAPLDPSRIEERVAIDMKMQGAEIESQILLGMLDQQCHSSLPLGWSGSGVAESTALYHSVWRKYCAVPEPAGTSYHGFFGHLYGYGATYYSYLFDRAIAGKVWRDVLQRRPGGAVTPEAGSLFREEVLRWGGGRDGWQCVAGALQDRDGVLAEGGKGAMEMVGSWGVHG